MMVFSWTGLLASTALCGGLAWAGHGGTGAAPGWHLAADVTHLVVCGYWPAGLLPFAWLLLALRRDLAVLHVAQPPSAVFDRRSKPFAPIEETSASGGAQPGAAVPCVELLRQTIALLTRRFSAIALACVVALALTGIVNSWALLGPITNFVRTGYGKLLLFKIALFLVMVSLGAINLLYLKPRLWRDGGAGGSRVARALQVNVAIELLLGAIIIAVVGMLGLLPPGAE